MRPDQAMPGFDLVRVETESRYQDCQSVEHYEDEEFYDPAQGDDILEELSDDDRLDLGEYNSNMPNDESSYSQGDVYEEETGRQNYTILR